MFSVIVPLYNKAKYIEKCLQSVFNQTFREFELIVIDDGSSDDGYSIANDMCNSQIVSDRCNSLLTKVLKQENRGVATTRNSGVALSKFDYIAFLDADDWWEPTFLEEMKNLIHSFPVAGTYASNYYKIKNGKRIVANIGVDIDFVKGEIDYFKVYSKTLWMPVWTGATVIRKESFREVNGFKPQLKLGEDFDLWVRLSVSYPVVFLNKPLANYNQDVDVEHRAVGEKLYLPHEHMLFGDYSILKESDKDFQLLFERLQLYGLLYYYLSDKYFAQSLKLLNEIHWKDHDFKYYFYYKILSPSLLKKWFDLLKFASKIKQFIIRRFISRSN